MSRLTILMILVAMGKLHVLVAWKNALVIVADDAGFESSILIDAVVRKPPVDAVLPETKGLESIAAKGVVFDKAFTAVSSCSPSRSSILSGLPPHQNGMYGLHQSEHHFNSFDKVQSISNILRENGIITGIIGKKHVGPKQVYKFDFERTEEEESTLQVGRNITRIMECVREFLDKAAVEFGCGHSHPEFGSFCELFGNGQPGKGVIPDWKPTYYDPRKVYVPYFVPDTLAARSDIAAQYTAINRMDQGIQLILKELEARDMINETLMLYTSDNGIPFPSGRTNLYDPGMKEPFILADPGSPKTWGHRNTRAMHGEGRDFRHNKVFSSHSLHEVTMYYPMRVIRTRRYKLIHNLNYKSPFPIDQDFYISHTWRDLLNRTKEHKLTKWYKNITGYYYRDQWELFDLKRDPKELQNRANSKRYARVFKKLRTQLKRWMKSTDDPWICSPSSVLENKGDFALQPQCLPLYNDT